MTTNDDGSVTHSVSFTLGAGDVREVNDGAVEAYDVALGAVGDGEVMHFMDPRRIQAFAAGGPPVWSVAAVPMGGDTLYLTYGLSGALDPAREGWPFEMSVRVRGEATMWPALFLRGLCRYMITSGRALEVGQFMPFPAPITRFAVAPAEAGQMPATPMNAACVTTDPALPRIEAPGGAVEVRRAYGVYTDELRLFEVWSAAGFVDAVRAKDPTLTTDIARPSHAADPSVASAVEAGAAREGSTFGFVAVPGVGWSEDASGIRVQLPGGAQATRIHRMLSARLPFGRHLLVHDEDPANPLAVAFEPSEQTGMRIEGPTLILSLPADHSLFASLTDASDRGIQWNLG